MMIERHDQRAPSPRLRGEGRDEGADEIRRRQQLRLLTALPLTRIATQSDLSPHLRGEV